MMYKKKIIKKIIKKNFILVEKNEISQLGIFFSKKRLFRQTFSSVFSRLDENKVL